MVRINAFNRIIAALARSYQVLVADLASQPISELEVTDDGFHPNDRGHERIANAYLAALRPHLPPTDQ